MKKELKKYKKILKLITQHKPHPCCYKLIDKADNKLLKFICECALNIDEGNIPLTFKQYKSLRKFKPHIKTLKSKKTSKKIKKKILQEGGFLPALAIPILTALLK